MVDRIICFLYDEIIRILECVVIKQSKYSEMSPHFLLQQTVQVFSQIFYYTINLFVYRFSRFRMESESDLIQVHQILIELNLNFLIILVLEILMDINDVYLFELEYISNPVHIEIDVFFLKKSRQKINAGDL